MCLSCFWCSARYSTSSSWTLLSSEKPLDPGARTLTRCAFGVWCRVIYTVWQWIYLCCPVRTACSYFICRHQMDTIRVYTHRHCSQNPISKVIEMEAWPRSSSVVNMLVSAKVWKRFCRICSRYIMGSSSVLHMVWGWCVKMVKLFTERE